MGSKLHWDSLTKIMDPRLFHVRRGHQVKNCDTRVVGQGLVYIQDFNQAPQELHVDQ